MRSKYFDETVYHIISHKLVSDGRLEVLLSRNSLVILEIVPKYSDTLIPTVLLKFAYSFDYLVLCMKDTDSPVYSE